MKNKFKLQKVFLMASIVIAMIEGCEDFLETDLTEDKVILMSPSDGIETKNLTLTFWWDKIEGANHYNIQIVSPTFLNIEKLVLDSLTLNNTYETSLIPGDYEWRVLAKNSSSIAYSDTFSFKIDTVSSK